jgi:integrase
MSRRKWSPGDPRRSPGEGSIYERSNGLFAGAITVAPGRRKTFYGKSRREVQQKMVAAMRDHQLGLLPTGGRQTVEQVLTVWLEQVAKPKVRPKTYITYSQLLKDHVIPSIGKVAVERLRPEQVQALLNRKSTEGLSPRSVFHIRATLRAGLNNAVRWGAVARNVVTLTDPPRVPSAPVQVLSQGQARTLLDAARGHDLEGLLTVAVGLGLRQGEALGLRWLDVDLERNELDVRHALQRIDGELVLVEPKTEKSRRTIVMPAVVTAALWDHRQREVERRQALLHDSGFVFCRPDGSPLDGPGVTRRFQRLLAQAGLPRMPFHGLRHSAASLMLAAGVQPLVVQETLGHSSIATTMGIYAHVLATGRSDAADIMDRVLGGS